MVGGGCEMKEWSSCRAGAAGSPFACKQDFTSMCLSVTWLLLDHRIIESLRLEKTCKIIRSNRQPITTTPAKPCPEVQHLHVF